MKELHSLLRRQLKAHVGGRLPDSPEWRALLEAVDEAYRQFDADRLMLERSLDLSSQELVEANKELRAILQLLPDVFFRIKPDGEILDGSVRSASKVFPSVRELIGTRLQDLPPRTYFEPFSRAVGEVVARKTRAVIEFAMDANGSTIYYEASLLPLVDTQIIVFIRDISQRRRVEEALRTSERKHRELADTLPETVFECDADGNILYLNATGLRDFGRTSADLARGLNIRDLINPDLRGHVAVEIERAMRGDAYEQEWLVHRRDGGVFPVFVQAIPVLQEGRPIGLRGIAINMAARKQAEMERARLHTAIEQAAESVMITDDRGSILYVNPAFERITGYAKEEVLGQNPRLLSSGKQDKGYYRHMWELLQQGHVWGGRLVDRRKDGTCFEWDSTISPVRDSDGAIVNFVAVSRDVTREVQLEEQLRQSHKMEAIGRLAGGVAHDFNNLLTVIIGNIELILPDLANDDPKRQSVTEIHEAALRAAELIAQLLAFGRRQVLHPKLIDLNAVVQRMETMFRRLLGENIVLQVRPEAALARIRADPTQMEQVLMNLTLNARDAMPGGGLLTIATGNASVDAEQAQRLGEIRPGLYVVLEISDTGTGMDAETLQHLFEPFFTTKDRGKGTGLGLATVYGIVKQSGGHVSVYSEPRRGSTFRVYLPLVGESGGQPAPEPQATGLVTGKETILVVEDEDLVRKLACSMLEKHGYKVLIARNGDEAVRMLARTREPIDLVLSDVVMPGMQVEDMANAIQAERPGLNVLYMSGHPESTITHLGLSRETLPLIKKPFTSMELCRRVREMLDR
jgi:two-component system cell cycle sensor histidine kinase/response regulator CckA